MFENDNKPVDDITGLLSKTQFKLNLIMVLAEWLINVAVEAVTAIFPMPEYM